MKNLPLTNLDNFENVFRNPPWPLNCELFGHGIIDTTCHFQRKNNRIEGIEITWSGNPFDLDGWTTHLI